jgi:hypothetical protein
MIFTLPLRKTYTMVYQEQSDASLKEAFNEKGERISPQLPKHVKNFLIDIDGTVCDDVPNEEPERMEDAAIYPDALQKCNQCLVEKPPEGGVEMSATRWLCASCWTDRITGRNLKQVRGL